MTCILQRTHELSFEKFIIHGFSPPVILKWSHIYYMAGGAAGQERKRTGRMEMSNTETLNQYIKELFDYWSGKNDDFEPIPIPKEVDDEMQRDSFY